MTGSFVIYKGRDFEANDVGLQIWMFYLIQEAQADPDSSEWKEELIEDWSDVITWTALGSVWTRLDHFAGEQEHRDKLIEYAENALDRLRSESKISIDILGEKGIGGDVRYYEDIPSDRIAIIGRKFSRLLKGETLEI